MPHINVEFDSREEIRAGVERLREGLWDYFVQTAHPGTIQVEGDTAVGRAYIAEFGRMRDGGSLLNMSLISAPDQQAGRGDAFGPVVDVPPDAPLLDRVIGLSGRNPSWAPPPR